MVLRECACGVRMPRAAYSVQVVCKQLDRQVRVFVLFRFVSLFPIFLNIFMCLKKSVILCVAER